MDELGREVLGEPLQDRGWTFGFDRAKTRLGVCRPRTKRITLSSHLSRTLPTAEVEDTVRHEIAHALDVERRGRTNHDRTWKALARRCGATPERCYAGDLPDDPAAPYACTCPGCGATLDRYRQPATPLRCQACAHAGRPAYFRVTHRASGAVVWPGGATPGDYGGTAGVEATCPRCGAVYRRARRPKRKTACAPCCRRHAGGRYDDRFRLRYG
jgi:predicted SprT family Zn-dependent metalloprotease